MLPGILYARRRQIVSRPKGDVGLEISLCMIVRNEEAHLGRCLDSVRSAVDEIVIVDTGSADRTKEVAARYTEQVYDYEWNDDFSAARNTAFSYASKPFLLWLDADDVMEESELDKLLLLKDRLDERVDAVMMPYLCGQRPDGSPELVFERERILRRDAGFRFSGVVHEAIVLRGNVIHENIAVRHLGEHGERSAKRNLALYERAMERGMRMTPRDQYYYARELMANGLLVRAEQAFSLFLHMGGWEENIRDAHVQRGHCLKRLGRTKEAKVSYLEAMGMGVPSAQALCALGALMLEEGDVQAAIFWYETALGMEIPAISGGFVYADAYRYLPAIQLCVCYDRLGQRQKAMEMNELALAYRPGDPSGVYNRAYFADRRAKGAEAQAAVK